jgi:hypothetical protein
VYVSLSIYSIYTVRSGQSGQDSQMDSQMDSQNRIIRTEQPEQDSWNRIAGTG